MTGPILDAGLQTNRRMGSSSPWYRYGIIQRAMKRLILILFLPALLFPQTAEEIAKKAEAKLRSYRSLQADFKQFYYSATISTPLEEKGKLYLMKPGWMKWEYKDPEKKIFLLKDGLYQQYLEEEKQLLESDLSTEENEFNVFTLLSGSTGILENYTVELSPFPTDNSHAHQLKLTPGKKIRIPSSSWRSMKKPGILIKLYFLIGPEINRNSISAELRPMSTFPQTHLN